MKQVRKIYRIQQNAIEHRTIMGAMTFPGFYVLNLLPKSGAIGDFLPRLVLGVADRLKHFTRGNVSVPHHHHMRLTRQTGNDLALLANGFQGHIP